jgi:hypothetical protein
MNERLHDLYKQAFGYFPSPIGEPELEKFAELVAASEREACAKIAETAIYRHDIADAIRKRKEESEC